MSETLVHPQSVVIGGAVFVAAYNSHDVLRYETRSGQWSVLPSCPVKWFGLGQLSGKLVTVGGGDGRGAAVNHVYTYVQETQQWEESIPPIHHTTPHHTSSHQLLLLLSLVCLLSQLPLQSMSAPQLIITLTHTHTHDKD